MSLEMPNPVVPKILGYACVRFPNDDKYGDCKDRSIAVFYEMTNSTCSLRRGCSGAIIDGEAKMFAVKQIESIRMPRPKHETRSVSAAYVLR